MDPPGSLFVRITYNDCMNIYVGGVNGVGKSTILRRAAQIDKRLEIIHYSSAVMQLLGLGPNDYEAFHKLSQKVCNQATSQLMNDLIRRQTERIRLIDGHFLAIHEGTIYQLAGDWVARLDGLVLVTASFEVQWRRLQTDDRWLHRRIFKPGATKSEAMAELPTYIEKTKHEFDDWAKQFRLDHLELAHNDDDVDRAAHKLINFIDTLRG